MEYPKKLIEVALPLDDINAACAHEKMPGIGPHPRGIHHWWSRKPLSTVRAVLFAQMVNDPGGERGWGRYKGQTKADAQKEREYYFDIIRELIKWKNVNNKAILEKAKEEILKSWKETTGNMGENIDSFPPIYDPFCGGGSIPMEAQRLGLLSYGSDLNPVSVIISKALIDIPFKFSGCCPVGPLYPKYKTEPIIEYNWNEVEGLAEDLQRYGYWMLEEAKKRIGQFYPKVTLPKRYGGKKANIIAWLWCRTVKCPNPACGIMMPLASKFELSKKKGKHTWVDIVINRRTNPGKINFSVKTGEGIPPKGTVNRSGARCVVCENPVTFDYIRKEGKMGRIDYQLMAIVAEGNRERIYLNPTKELEKQAKVIKTQGVIDTNLPAKALGFRVQQYGMTKYCDLFTNRQLLALTTLSDLILETREMVIKDAQKEGMSDNRRGLNDGGTGATAYGDALATYLALAVDRSADFNNSLTSWLAGNEKIMHLFSRQAIPMAWDFGEANILENVVGGFITHVIYQSKCLLKVQPNHKGYSKQADVINPFDIKNCVISTDPPYYDNIGYSDLSDFFYVWLRRSLKTIYPDLFSTLLVPKSSELVASVNRHGSKTKAEEFFVQRMSQALHNMLQQSHVAYPITIYYAFKQSESKKAGTASVGWEAFLNSIIKTGFVITGTWPMRSEQSTRLVGIGTNALASSIIIVCRKRPKEAQTISRKQFLRDLEETLPEALEDMIGGKQGASPIAPVDLAQAAIGPGMAVFSKYKVVLEADGSPMTVRNALILINKAIDEYFTDAESDMEADTRFCVDWFHQYGFREGPFGEADVLARAKGTTVDGIQNSGVIKSGGGKVRLLKIKEYPSDRNPAKDLRSSVWEACHHLCGALKENETEAGALLAQIPEKTEPVRQLAYRLYTLCERRGWAEDARTYNELITSWHGIVKASQDVGIRRTQKALFEDS